MQGLGFVKFEPSVKVIKFQSFYDLKIKKLLLFIFKEIEEDATITFDIPMVVAMAQGKLVKGGKRRSFTIV